MFLDTSDVSRNTYKPWKTDFKRFIDPFHFFQKIALAITATRASLISISSRFEEPVKSYVESIIQTLKWIFLEPGGEKSLMVN